MKQNSVLFLALIKILQQELQILEVSLDREVSEKLHLKKQCMNYKSLKKLKGYFMFIIMDAATRHRANYIAINARFVDENKK